MSCREWVRITPPTIPGVLEAPDIGKRFWKFNFRELFDRDSEVIRELAKKLMRAEQICRYVIEEIKYPFWFGQPDDKHVWNAFHGKFCVKVKHDFWQKASETAVSKYGDCEDKTILWVTLMDMNLYKCYGFLGIVYYKDKPLGGHAWGAFEDVKGNWRLYESTLEKAPSYPHDYPVIPDPDTTNEFKVGRLRYVAIARFTTEEFWLSKRGVGIMTLKEYLTLPHKKKHTKKKIKLIRKAWAEYHKYLIETKLRELTR